MEAGIMAEDITEADIMDTTEAITVIMADIMGTTATMDIIMVIMEDGVGVMPVGMELGEQL
jgi:hypothetical protein